MELTITHPTNRPNYSKVYVTNQEGLPIEITFSYETPIAVEFTDTNSGEHHLYTRPNRWGPTTGRHLRQATDGRTATTLPEPEFVALIHSL